jgi:hypothetical protein
VTRDKGQGDEGQSTKSQGAKDKVKIIKSKNEKDFI